MKSYKIAVLKGDGIGSEIINEALKILKEIESKCSIKFDFNEALIGGAAIDEYGIPLPDSTLNLAKSSDAILFGAIGGEKWDNLARDLRPESGLLALRKNLGVYANVRPLHVYEHLLDFSPLKKERILGADFVIVRELIGGIYFGEPREYKKDRAFNTMIYSKNEIEKIARFGFDLAMKRNKKLTLIDKANVLEVSQLWREVVSEIAREFKGVELNFMYVDNCAMQLILNPKQFDVILCENLFGDILSDEASVIGGSIGLLASASIGEHIGLFEPIHGSAPDIAGKNIANPIATILSAKMMLEFLGEQKVADLIDNAITKVLAAGYRTRDLGGNIACDKMGDLIAETIRSEHG